MRENNQFLDYYMYSTFDNLVPSVADRRKFDQPCYSGGSPSIFCGIYSIYILSVRTFNEFGYTKFTIVNMWCP